MLGLIWAQSADGFIGRDGSLPWHLPEDLARFKELTTGHPVLMGRTTWDSLPAGVRPLPGRDNVVLSRQAALRLDGARVVGGTAEALAVVGERDAWVIGGAQAYTAFLPLADRLEVTDVDVEVAGDTPAPEVGDGWREVTTGAWARSRTGPRYRYRTLVRA